MAITILRGLSPQELDDLRKQANGHVITDDEGLAAISAELLQKLGFDGVLTFSGSAIYAEIQGHLYSEHPNISNLDI